MLEMVAPARFLEWLQLFVQSPVQVEPSRPSACSLPALLFCGLHFRETASRHSYALSPLDVIVRSDRAWGWSKKAAADRRSDGKSRQLLLSESALEENGYLIPLPIIGQRQAFDRMLRGGNCSRAVPGLLTSKDRIYSSWDTS